MANPQKSVLALMAVLVFSCKAKKTMAEGDVVANASAKSVIRSHYDNQIDFTTLAGKLRVTYTEGKTEQTVGLSLRMKKEEAIWMSAPLGMAKIFITPQKVRFYNKLENAYFEGDFSYLSQLVGTDLDFGQLQRLLLGEALFDLRDKKYSVEVAQGHYQLKPKRSGGLYKQLLQIAPGHFRIASEQLSQPERDRLLRIDYTAYQKVGGRVLPSELHIDAREGDDNRKIAVDFQNMAFDQEVRFPYKVPKGFKKIR